MLWGVRWELIEWLNKQTSYKSSLISFEVWYWNKVTTRVGGHSFCCTLKNWILTSYWKTHYLGLKIHNKESRFRMLDNFEHSHSQCRMLTKILLFRKQELLDTFILKFPYLSIQLLWWRRGLEDLKISTNLDWCIFYGFHVCYLLGRNKSLGCSEVFVSAGWFLFYWITGIINWI